MSRGRFAKCTLSLVLLSSEPVAASALVVRVSGPVASYLRTGTALPDTQVITLTAQDRLTLLTSTGTRDFKGPRRFRVSDPSTQLTLTEILKRTIDQSKGGQRVRAGVSQSEKPGADLAQLDEARCFTTGICGVEAEKKFSLANIGSASAEANRGGSPVVAPPSISDMSIALMGTRPVCDLGFRPFRLAFYDRVGQTVVISGPRRTQRELNLRQMLEFVNWSGPRRKFKKVGEVTFGSGSGQTIVPIIATKVRREPIARLKARLAAAGCTAQAAAL